MKNFFVLALTVTAYLFPVSGWAPQLKMHAGDWCFPENNYKIGVDDFRIQAGGIDEATFNRVIDRALSVYAPIARAKGGNLVVNRLWNDGTVNAQAYRQGSNWYVNMFGGLARYSPTTEEGFYLVICHEIGHHLGGAPRYSGGPDRNWAAAEGEADYFANLKCLRRVFAGMSNQVANEPPGVRAACERSFSNPDDVAICIRSTMGGYSSANITHALAGGGGAPPNIATPDPRQVAATVETHPAAQCRLDTYFNGSTCTAPLESEPDYNDPEMGGVCSVKQKHEFGKRPLCWYKPAGSGPGGPGDPGTGDIARAPLLNGQASLQLANPNQQVVITYDVSNFPNAAGVYIELSRPNQPFSNPNSTLQDPNALGGAGVRGQVGQFAFIPAQQLPSWGTYYLRVIPLDSTGRTAVGKFSNSASLLLQQGRGFPRGGGFPRPAFSSAAPALFH